MQLVIAEKPALGKAIADAIPGQGENKDSVITKQFNGDTIKIIWCVGHLLTLKDPEDYDPALKSWTIESLPIFFENWETKIAPESKEAKNKKRPFTKAQRVKQIGALLKEATSVIHAADRDEEGQLLVDELLRMFQYSGPVYRLDTQDTAPAALRRALGRMENNKNYEADGYSAYGREISDKLFGFNLTRYYSVLNNHLFPVGRVQTPTLGLVVRRDALIEGHHAMNYYVLQGYLDIDGNNIEVKFTPQKDDSHLTDGKILDKNYLCEVNNEIDGKHFAPVVVTTTTVSAPPPLPFNLTKLTTYCGAKWDMTPSDVMRITQELRDKYNAITYNRSDCQYLSEEAFKDAPHTVAAAAKNLGVDEKSFDTSIKSRCFNDANIGSSSHFAIIPTNTKQDVSTFSADEARVYEAIAKRYLIQFLPPVKKLKTRLTAAIAEKGSFDATSTKILFPGYLAFLGGNAAPDEQNSDDSEDEKEIETDLSKMAAGNYEGEFHSKNIVENATKPPARYTATTLAEDMTRIAKYVENSAVKKLLLEKDKDKKGENGSIGTSATRAKIVDSLIERGYLREEKKGKRTYLISTDMGREFYAMLPDSIKKVDVTAKWWSIQEDIKLGRCSANQMGRDVLKTVEAIIRSGEGTMENAETYAKGILGDCLGKCPKCGGDVFETGKGYKCTAGDCKFFIFKDNALFKAIGKSLSPAVVKYLLSKGKVGLKNCTSTKTGRKFDCILVADFSGERVEFTFDNNNEQNVIGPCPICHSDVIEQIKTYSCSNPQCNFVLWKENRFFVGVLGKKGISTSTAKAFLKNRKATISNVESKKKPGTMYNPIIVMSIDDENRANFSFDGFAAKKMKK